MPTPAVSLRLKRFRQRFGITAPRVVVRGHLAWQWFAVPMLFLVVMVGVVGWLITQRNETGSLGREVEVLRQQLLAQREELIVLRSTAGTGQNAVGIERASQQLLLERIQLLESQNAALKEDMLLFERLIPESGEGPSIRIENFRIVQEAQGRYRYRLLLAFRHGRQTPDFRGRLQLAISFLLSGKKGQLMLPDKRENGSEYQIELKHFLRREGIFDLPAGAVLQGVEARVLQGDSLKSKRSAQL